MSKIESPAANQIRINLQEKLAQFADNWSPKDASTTVARIKIYGCSI